MTEQEQRDFERRSRAAFEASVAALNGATRSRLARARQAALVAGRRWPLVARTWVPAGALAAAAVLAVALWSGREAGPVTPALAAAEDFELLAAGDDFEMLDEDAAFYAWVAEVQADGAG